MTPEKYALIAMIILETLTLAFLWKTQQAGEWFRKAWIRESKELLH